MLQGPDWSVWNFINDNYIPLLTTNILISYALSTFVYIRSFTVKQPKDPQDRELAHGGTTGNLLYDWFIGRELNPQIRLPFFGDVDIKTFMEVRPGMLGWCILDLAFMMRQWKTYGYVTDAMCKRPPLSLFSTPSNTQQSSPAAPSSSTPSTPSPSNQPS